MEFLQDPLISGTVVAVIMVLTQMKLFVTMETMTNYVQSYAASKDTANALKDSLDSLHEDIREIHKDVKDILTKL